MTTLSHFCPRYLGYPGSCHKSTVANFCVTYVATGRLWSWCVGKLWFHLTEICIVVISCHGISRHFSPRWLPTRVRVRPGAGFILQCVCGFHILQNTHTQNLSTKLAIQAYLSKPFNLCTDLMSHMFSRAWFCQLWCVPPQGTPLLRASRTTACRSWTVIHLAIPTTKRRRKSENYLAIPTKKGWKWRWYWWQR